MSAFRPYWTFYPLHGIKIISDDSPIDQSLMFDDATIVSSEEIEKIISCFEIDEDRERYNFKMHLQMVAQQGDSIIIIRGSEKDIDKMRRQADKRVLEIVSAISNLLLMYTDFHYTCSLPDEFHRLENSTTFSWHQQLGRQHLIERLPTRACVFYIFDPPLTINRSALREKLFDERFKAYSTCLLTTSRAFPKKTREIISSASIHAYTTCNSSTPEAQLIGAVTTIEILLKHSEREYDKIHPRLQLLISKEAYDFYFAEEVIKERHKCVHEGLFTHRDLAHHAIRIASNALINYASLSPQFNSYGKVNQFLDLIEHCRRFPELQNLRNDINAAFKVAPPTDIVNPTPFFLVNYALTEKDLNSEDIEKVKMHVVQYARVLSILSPMNIADAYTLLQKSCLASVLPFATIESFMDYWKINKQQVIEGARKRVETLHKYTWRVKKYKWQYEEPTDDY